jgi:hypothetical protein
VFPSRRRYATALTDAQGRSLSRSSPRPSRAAVLHSTRAASCSTRCCTGLGPAVPGGCPMTCHPGRPSTTTSTAGACRPLGVRPQGRWVRPSGSVKPQANPERGDPGQPEHEDRERGPDSYDGDKKVNGRKLYLLVDTLGLICKTHVTDVGDHDGTELLRRLDRRHLPAAAARLGGRRVPWPVPGLGVARCKVAFEGWRVLMVDGGAAGCHPGGAAGGAAVRARSAKVGWGEGRLHGWVLSPPEEGL